MNEKNYLVGSELKIHNVKNYLKFVFSTQLIEILRFIVLGFDLCLTYSKTLGRTARVPENGVVGNSLRLG